ncbi:MAG: ABC transporter ATP-binding protein [Planctomycetota bacterium]
MRARHFLRFAKRLLRYPRVLALAVTMAFASAVSLGAGLLAIVPVLNAILGDGGSSLQAMTLERRAEGGLLWLPVWFVEALPDTPYHSLLVSVMTIGVLTVIGASANFAHAYLSATVVIRVVSDVRRTVYRRLLRLPLASAVSGSAMDLVSRALNDSQALAGGLSAMVSKALASVAKAVALFTSALIVDWRITLAASIALPALVVIVRRLSKTIRRAARGALRSQADLLTAAGQAMPALRTVKASRAERVELGRFSAANRTLVREQMRSRTARAAATPLTELVALFVLGVLALIAGKAIIDGALEASAFLVALGSLAMAANELKRLSGVIGQVQTAEAASQRLEQVLAMPIEVVHDRAAPVLPRHTESIAFDGVSFRYPGGERPALDGVTLQIDRGARGAFVGPNGSGKTTLLSLVPRFFDPQNGRVLIDGVDVRGVRLSSVRRQIAVVPQEVVLFAGTLTANIGYGVETTPADIERATEMAGASGFIGELQDGLDAMVGEGGLTLSGGQRQRVAIARAIARDPAILITDEATSMVDAESEAAINAALSEFASGRTWLIVAHRLSTVLAADRIVVMDAGRVVDQGTHTELLERCDVYRRLTEHQLQPA